MSKRDESEVPDLTSTSADDVQPEENDPDDDDTLGPGDDPDADPDAPEDHRVVTTDHDPGPLQGNSDEGNPR